MVESELVCWAARYSLVVSRRYCLLALVDSVFEVADLVVVPLIVRLSNLTVEKPDCWG